MKITTSNPEKLVIVDFPYVIGFFCLVGAGVLGCQVVKLWLNHTLQQKDMMGMGLGFALFFAAGSIFAKRSVFTFDIARRQLIWSRRGLFTWKGATVPFSQITDVTVQTSSDSDSTTHRVALTTTQGILPLTESYSGGGDRPARAIGIAIRRALGLPEQPEAEVDAHDLRALIASGQIINAIKLVREGRHCSLAEAKKIVDDMMKSPGA